MKEIEDGINSVRIDMKKLFYERYDQNKIKMALIRAATVLIIIALSVVITIICTKDSDKNIDKEGNMGMSDTENGIYGIETDEITTETKTEGDTDEDTDAEETTEGGDAYGTQGDIAYRDISRKEYGDAYIVNKTDNDLMYDPYAEYPKYYTNKSPYPLVLVLHTNDRREYDGKSIVDVGYELTDALNRSGIATVHCSARHEDENIVDSYGNAAQSIEFYMRMYPSIKYIIDVDQLVCDENDPYITIGNYNGTGAAQIRFDVCGKNTDNRDANVDLAVQLRSYLNRGEMNIAGEVYVDDCVLNSIYSEYYLTLKIGSSYNTLDEAKNAAVAFAFAFAEHMK